MIIKKTGRYKLIKNWSSRGPRSILNLQKGDTIEITQIDERGHKVIGPDLEDWAAWDLPVVEDKDGR